MVERAPGGDRELPLRALGLDRLASAQRRRAVEVAESMSSLEALPQVVHRALDCIQNSQSSSTELASVIATDQAIAARVLGVANSVYGRGSRQFVSLHEAVVRIGYRNVQDIVLSVAVTRFLEEPLPLYEVGPGELWRHSLATAVATRLLATQYRLAQVSSAYIAGLLHDAGRAMLDRALTYREKSAIRGAVSYERIGFHQAEYQILGFSHAEVGAVLLHRWGLTEEVVRAIARHHQPAALSNEPLSAAIHAGDVLGLLALPIRQPGWLYSVDAGAASRFGLSSDDRTTPTIIRAIEEGLQHASRLISPG